MDILFGLICLFLLMAAFLFSNVIRYTRSQKKALVFFLAISIAILAFHANPPVGWDLFRHFIYMDNIRNSEISLFRLLFNNPSRIGGYPTLFCFNLLRYIICHFTENNHWLPAVCVFLDYGIVGYIMLDWYETSGFREKFSFVVPFLCCTLLPPVHAFSGMRHALAACIMGLSIYLYIYKKKKIIVFIALAFVAITIHQAVLVSIPFVFLSRVRLGKKGILAVVCISFSVRSIAELFQNSRYMFLTTIANKYFHYSSESQYRASVYPLWADMLLVLSFLALYFLLGDQFRKMLWRREQEMLYLFLVYYMCFIVGNFGNYDLVLRPCYLLGVFAPVLASFVENKTVWKSIHGKGIQLIGKILCTTLCLLASFMYIRQIATNAF